MPRDVSLSDSKCLNGGHEWIKTGSIRSWPIFATCDFLMRGNILYGYAIF